MISGGRKAVYAVSAIFGCFVLWWLWWLFGPQPGTAVSDVEQGRPIVKLEIKGGHAYDIPINYFFYDYLKAYRGMVTPNSPWPIPDVKRRQLGFIWLEALLPDLSGWRRADHDVFKEPGALHTASIYIHPKDYQLFIPENKALWDRVTRPLPIGDVPNEYIDGSLVYRQRDLGDDVYFYEKAPLINGIGGYCSRRKPEPLSTPHCYLHIRLDNGDVAEINIYYAWFSHRQQIVSDVRKLIAPFETPSQKE